MLFEQVEHWLAHDPDATSRAELTCLLAKARAGDGTSLADLGDRFRGPLAFGTAGLRGLMGAGESRMNRAVVRRTTLGLGHYSIESAHALARTAGVVIGYDGRHLGREFAEDAALVLAALGIPAKVTQQPSSTPLLAYAVTSFGAAAGIMVTASHNPRGYNGYKVYGPNGAQIVPPHDAAIAARIALVPEADQVVLADRDLATADGLLQFFGDAVDRRYFDGVRRLSLRADGDRGSPSSTHPSTARASASLEPC